MDTATARETVQMVLAAMAAHDWETVRAKVAANVVRVGPYRDEYRGRDDYVGFLAGLMPGLPGYAMHVDRVLAVDSNVVVAELREIVDVDGAPLETPEALVFDLDDQGQIVRIAVYTQNETPRPH